MYPQISAAGNNDIVLTDKLVKSLYILDQIFLSNLGTFVREFLYGNYFWGYDVIMEGSVHYIKFSLSFL